MTNDVDWRAVYDALKRQRVNAQREIDELDAGMRLAERMIAESVDRRAAVSTDDRSGSQGPYASLSLVEAAVEVLRAARRSMTAREISDRVIAGGKPHALNSSYALLAKAVNGSSGIVRFEDKTFGLAEWGLARNLGASEPEQPSALSQSFAAK